MATTPGMTRAIHELRRKADEWDADVARRRAITPLDPVADTRAFDARELRELAMALDTATEEIGTDEYAMLHKTTAQTVTRWARLGRIKARYTPSGWRIPRDTPAPRRRSKAVP